MRNLFYCCGLLFSLSKIYKQITIYIQLYMSNFIFELDVVKKKSKIYSEEDSVGRYKVLPFEEWFKKTCDKGNVLLNINVRKNYFGSMKFEPLQINQHLFSNQ